MSDSDTHFELYLRRNIRDGWNLAEAVPDRQAAHNRAEALVEKNPNAGVRIMKDVMDAKSGGYRSILIGSIGNCDEPRAKGKERPLSDTGPSCLAPADLLSVAARRTYLEVMARYLERFKLLPVELTLRADVLERLEASGTEITQAIQKIAIARSAGGEDLHEIARQLHDLVSRAIDQVFKDKRNGVLTTLETQTLAELMFKLRGRSNADYRLTYALVDMLRPHSDWKDKLSALLDIWRASRSLEENDTLIIDRVLEGIFAEWIASPGALKALTGDAATGGEAMQRLVDVLAPSETHKTGSSPKSELALLLSTALANNLLPAASQAIVSRVFAELRSERRLATGTLYDEFAVLRRLADQLTALENIERRPEMVEAFGERCRKLLSTENVDAFLGETPRLDRPLKLAELAENIVGTAAKTRLMGYIRRELEHPHFERHLTDADSRPTQGLKSLRTLQIRLIGLKWRIPEAEATIQAIDDAGQASLVASGLIAKLTAKAASPVDASILLLNLTANVLPVGGCTSIAMAASARLLKASVDTHSLQRDPVLKTKLAEASAAAQKVLALRAAG